MFVLGVTGGIGSGKSTVAALLRSSGEEPPAVQLGTSPQHPLELEQILDVPQPAGVTISPDGELVAAAFDVLDELTVDNVSSARLARPLHDLGFVDGDIFSLHRRQEPALHFHLGAKSNG